MNKINICGVTYRIKEVDEIPPENKGELVQGDITYHTGIIQLRKDMPEEIKRQTLIHEWVHGMFVMIGRNDLSEDETLVQNVALAINNTFKVKESDNETDN